MNRGLTPLFCPVKWSSVGVKHHRRGCHGGHTCQSRRAARRRLACGTLASASVTLNSCASSLEANSNAKMQHATTSVDWHVYLNLFLFFRIFATETLKQIETKTKQQIVIREESLHLEKCSSHLNHCFLHPYPISPLIRCAASHMTMGETLETKKQQIKS